MAAKLFALAAPFLFVGFMWLNAKQPETAALILFALVAAPGVVGMLL